MSHGRPTRLCCPPDRNGTSFSLGGGRWSHQPWGLLLSVVLSTAAKCRVSWHRGRAVCVFETVWSQRTGIATERSLVSTEDASGESSGSSFSLFVAHDGLLLAYDTTHV